jgi:hypothetical protein
MNIPPRTLVRVIIEEIRTADRDSDPGKKFRYGENMSEKKALNAVGKFASGISDISERHDDYLSEAYGIGDNGGLRQFYYHAASSDHRSILL